MSGDEPVPPRDPAATAAAPPAPLYPAERTAVARGSATGWLALVIQGLAGAVGGFLGIQWLDRLIGGLDLGLLLLALGALVVVGWLQVLVHEAGHALAGALVGRRFVGAGIGPLQVDRGAGGRLTFRWARGIRGIAGYAVMLPRAREPRRRAAVFILGGPLANLACAAVAFALWQRLADPPPLVLMLLAITCAVGLVLGVVNLVPFHSHGWSTDGHGLLQLWGRPRHWQAMQAVQLALTSAVAGVRPRDWPAVPAAGLDELSPPLQANVQAVRLAAALDSGDAATARAAASAIAGFWSAMPDGQAQGAALMLATYAARSGDRALLAAWRPHCEGGLMDLGPARLWLDAEAACLDDDTHQARELAGQARAALPRIHDRSSQIVMGEYLDALEQRLDGQTPHDRAAQPAAAPAAT